MNQPISVLVPRFDCFSGAGFDDEGAREMMRLYQTIHTDHEVYLSGARLLLSCKDRSLSVVSLVMSSGMHNGPCHCVVLLHVGIGHIAAARRMHNTQTECHRATG